MVLMKHGVFSFGDTARESYDRMIDLVRPGGASTSNAQRAWRVVPEPRPAAPEIDGVALAELRPTRSAARPASRW